MARLSILLTAAIGVAAGAALGDDSKPAAKGPRVEPVIHKVQRATLSLDVFLRGTIESADNADVICRVKTGPNGLAVVWLIDDGTMVKKGQVLAKLDDAALQDRLQAQRVVLEQAKAAAAVAMEAVGVVMSRADSGIAAAQTAVELAELDLRKFRDGDYPQLLKDLRGRKRVADAELNAAREDVAGLEQLEKAGGIAAPEARARRIRLLAAEVAAERVADELRVLEQFTLPRTSRELEAKLTDAKRALDRTRLEAGAQRSQTDAERMAKLAVVRQEEARHREIERELRDCHIVAPRDGLTFYYLPDAIPFVGPETVLAVGEPVREGQRLFRIPDLSRMVVSVRVPESVVARVRIGQHVQAHADAHPGRELRGKVVQVPPVPVRGVRWVKDEKVYAVQVTLEGPTEGLKPGMSADTIIATGQSIEGVLTVPVQAVMPPNQTGQRMCVVRTPAGLEQREVAVGRHNGQMTEIRSGLREGDEVVLNPQALFAEPQRLY